MPVTTTRPNRPPTPRRPPPRRRSTLDALGPATFDAHGSVEQVWLIGAEPGAELRLVDEDAVVVATAAADAQGSLIFRDVPPADYRVAAADTVSDAVTVAAPDDHPDAAFYAAQDIVPGYGYLETRDGTLLAINVTLPGPPEAGPYPTVIEYSGYSPADPDSPQPSTLITSTLGFATVGINLRGTGCSGGAYDYFETLQSTDGYDAIETIAAQPWVEHGTVGMVGLSFPGITQLFVAATQPPHLSAIAPLSVIADTGRGTLRPGGILNDGFATSWATERQHDAEAAPQSGQAWAGRRIEDGDTTCADNQILRSQAVDLLATIDENPYWTDEVAAPVTPELFVDQITVPTFLAGAWQDEQVGGYLVNMTDNFTGTDRAWFTYTNGAHADPFDPATFVRWVEFLQLYVARDVPVRPPIADIIMGVLSGTVWGTAVTLPPDRFAGATSYDDALATFEADPRVRIQFENGAGGEPGLPYARFEAGFDAWPPEETEAQTWYFDADGALVDEAATADGTDSYTSDPAQSDVTTLARYRYLVDVGRAAALQLVRAAARISGCVRQRCTRGRHGDGRHRQYRSLGAGRHRRRRSRGDHQRGPSRRQRGVRAERVAAGQPARAARGRDRTATVAHAHGSRRPAARERRVERSARRAVSVRAPVPRGLSNTGDRRRAGRQPPAVDVRHARGLLERRGRLGR